jgi:hypothetical protein
MGMNKLDILNKTVSAARASIPTEVNPEPKEQQTSIDKDLALSSDAKRC